MTPSALQPIVALLRREVVPSVGCTEPIAVALCVARARKQLGQLPDEIQVTLSKNMYKNAMSVGIPNTGMTGLPIAIALGAIIGRDDRGLEILADATEETIAQAKEYMQRVPATICIMADAPSVVYIHARVGAHGQYAESTTQGSHTGQSHAESVELNMRRVYDFAMEVELQEVDFLLTGAQMNKQAAEYSFTHCCGHQLGKMLHTQPDTYSRILAYTSGACDARMSGAMIEVMSNSGSGNQGISCSLPVYIYAQDHHIEEEKLLRALTLSNLTAIYIKQSLGRLSALCGCVVAATGSAAGITYMMGGGYEEITYAIKNMIANITGMICDGAKPGCALKVTSGVSTAILSASLAMQHSVAGAQEGIIENDIDCTIHNLTRLGHDGMVQTDDMILDIMLHKQS